jgi:2-polyprenyl-3-methyl-5-hydroxy-6-metoxy-1,4-benzoquinol methylase
MVSAVSAKDWGVTILGGALTRSLHKLTPSTDYVQENGRSNSETFFHWKLLDILGILLNVMAEQNSECV